VDKFSLFGKDRLGLPHTVKVTGPLPDDPEEVAVALPELDPPLLEQAPSTRENVSAIKPNLNPNFFPFFTFVASPFDLKKTFPRADWMFRYFNFLFRLSVSPPLYKGFRTNSVQTNHPLQIVHLLHLSYYNLKCHESITRIESFLS